MSSMDQVFVKAFSRRRLAEPDRDARRQAPQQDATQAPGELDSESQLGSLELNRSVAGTAEVWVDTVEDPIARSDQASHDVPMPHVGRGFTVDRAVSFERTKIDTEVWRSDQPASAVEDRESVRDVADVDVTESKSLTRQHRSLALSNTFTPLTREPSPTRLCLPRARHRKRRDALRRIEDDRVSQKRWSPRRLSNR